jgi:hypothetical protein
VIATRGRPRNQSYYPEEKAVRRVSCGWLIAEGPKRGGGTLGAWGTGMGEMGVPVAVNRALASGIPTVMTSTLSRFADS